MKPVLILGLGNDLMGDDGVGCRVAELLAADPRLPSGAEAVSGGTDLLRWTDQMEGRARVLLIDAIRGEEASGSVEVFEEFSGLDHRQWNAHHLSLPRAVRLLQSELPDVRFTLVAITVDGVRWGTRLSQEMVDRLPGIVESVLRGL